VEISLKKEEKTSDYFQENIFIGRYKKKRVSYGSLLCDNTKNIRNYQVFDHFWSFFRRGVREWNERIPLAICSTSVMFGEVINREWICSHISCLDSPPPATVIACTHHHYHPHTALLEIMKLLLLLL